MIFTSLISRDIFTSILIIITIRLSDNQYPENRIRNWNAYMLFYETMEKSSLPPCSTSAFPDPRGQILGDIMRYENLFLQGEVPPSHTVPRHYPSDGERRIMTDYDG